MRKLMRSIAHARMKRAGIRHPHRKAPVFQNGKYIGMTKSYFALHWRDKEWQGTR